jgi:hypothetical protein
MAHKSQPTTFGKGELLNDLLWLLDTPKEKKLEPATRSMNMLLGYFNLPSFHKSSILHLFQPEQLLLSAVNLLPYFTSPFSLALDSDSR